MNDTLYLPLNSVNIAHYFATGIIAPSKYYSNRNEDIQNKFDNAILLSNDIIYNKDTDCSLEIVLDNNEKSDLKKISDIFFIIDKPLPISRVKSIIFENEEKSKDVLFNINTGDAFIPKNLVKIIEPKNIKISIPESLDFLFPEIDFNKKLDKFNRIMGGFALMRHGGEDHINYSKNYFKPLSLINNKIRQQLENSQFEFTENYNGFIDQSTDKSDFYKQSFTDINLSYIKELSKKDNINLPVKRGIIQFDQIDNSKRTYFFSILETYGIGKRKTMDDFFSGLITNKFDSKKEGISLIFGINKGYKAFRNFYKIIDTRIIVKFELNSKLDYYTIESIYQYIFNDKTNNYDFPYLDDWCPRFNDTKNYREYNTYKILDKTIIYKKKYPVGSTEYLQELFQSFSPKDIYNKIIQIINNWLPPFLKTEKTKEACEYFNKELEPGLKKFAGSIVTKVKTDLDNDNNYEKIDLNKKIEDLKKQLEEKINENVDLKKKYDELVLQHDDIIKHQNLDEKIPPNKSKEVDDNQNINTKNNEDLNLKSDQKENNIDVVTGQNNKIQNEENYTEKAEVVLGKTDNKLRNQQNDFRKKTDISEVTNNGPELEFAEEKKSKTDNIENQSSSEDQIIPNKKNNTNSGKSLQQAKNEYFNKLKSKKYTKDNLYKICDQKNIPYKKNHAKDYLAKLISDQEFRN